MASGADPAQWRALGHRLGEAYQVADDLLDAVSKPRECDKPVGRDAALGRPNAVAELGVAGAVARLQSADRRGDGIDSAVPGENELREMVRLQALRLAPKRLLRSAA